MENVLMQRLTEERNHFEYSQTAEFLEEEAADDDPNLFADFRGAWIHTSPSGFTDHHTFCVLHWALDKASPHAFAAIPPDLDFTRIISRLNDLGMKDSISLLMKEPATYPYYNKVLTQLRKESETRNRLDRLPGRIDLIPEG